MTLVNRPHPRNGWTIRELAEKTGASPRAIGSWTSEPRELYLERANAKRKAILELRLKGLSMKEIAHSLDISVGTVHRYVSEARNAGQLPPHVDNRKRGRPAKTEVAD